MIYKAKHALKPNCVLNIDILITGLLNLVQLLVDISNFMERETKVCLTHNNYSSPLQNNAIKILVLETISVQP